MQKILLLGGGGREHALAWKIAQSPTVASVLVIPGNDGMVMINKVTCQSGDPANVDDMMRVVRDMQPDLVVIGPEKPLAAGLADKLATEGFAVFGPTQAAAQLESSKVFSKQFMIDFAIPTAAFHVCASPQEALDTMATWDIDGKGIVVKADGLAAGKGVVVTHDRAIAEKTVADFMTDPACSVKSDRLLLEEKMVGKEVSAFALCDGEKFITLGYICDYKRVRDNDQGPNTGGMGGYAPTDWPSATARKFVDEHVFAAVLAGMKKRGTPFTGVLFAGLMVLGDDIKVIEFNTRFGDPETQILLPMLETDIVPLMAAAARGALTGAEKIAHKNAQAVHVVMASEGYPETSGAGMRFGQTIDVPESFTNDNSFLFIMGAAKKEGGWVNTGGRVLGVTAFGATIEEARKRAYDTVDTIHFDGAHWRKDIGR